MKTYIRTRPGRGPHTLGLWSVLLGTAIAVSGCSGGITEPTGVGAEGVSQTVTDAMKSVAEAETPAESFVPPTGKRILILQCSSTGQGCVNEASVSSGLAEKLGWTVDVVDGKFDPVVWNQAVKQAAESGVDGIISISADPNLMGEAMEIVQDKGIPFVLTNQFPADTDIGGIGAYVGPDPVTGGHDIADWIIADSGGQANVLLLDAPGFPAVILRTASVAEKLEADCPDCTIEKVDVSGTTMATTLAPQVTSRLQQNPDIDYVVAMDDCCVNFVYQGIQQAGRTADTKVVSVGGFAEQLQSLKTGTPPLAANLATPQPFMAWLSIDSLARLMADAPVEQQYWPAPQRLWTTANISEAPDEIFTPGSGWDVEFDYSSMFQGLWGTP